MADWEAWAQAQASKLIDYAGAAKVSNPYELQKLRLTALGPGGYYDEGQPGATSYPQTGSGSSMLILIGIAVVAVLVLND